MSDNYVLEERLRTIRAALQRIPRRFAGIETPDDFYATDAGIDRMDAICMLLIAAGEEFKAIDRRTHSQLLSRYPDVHWRGVIGVRDVLAHGYFQANAERLFAMRRDGIPQLIDTVTQMIQGIDSGSA
jgi:uncharacterized protein with HEPN domain